jgi:osmotically-inducible protein OsmY
MGTERSKGTKVFSVSGDVTKLNGDARSYVGKLATERAVKQVCSLKGAIQGIQGKVPVINERMDADIARAAAAALKWSVPRSRVKVTVRDGWVKLRGEVHSWNQKNIAEGVVRNLWGVCGVTNRISVKIAMTRWTSEYLGFAGDVAIKKTRGGIRWSTCLMSTKNSNGNIPK